MVAKLRARQTPLQALSIAIIAACAGPMVPAQRLSRLHRPVQAPARLGGVAGTVAIVGTELRWYAQGVSQVQQLPFVEVACGVSVGNEYLVCGRSTTGGTIVLRITSDRGALKVDYDRDYADLRIGALVYDEPRGDLFLLEEDQGAVFCVGPGRLPPLGSLDAIARIPDGWKAAWTERTEGGLCIGISGHHIRVYRSEGQWRQERTTPSADATIAVSARPPAIRGPVEIYLGAPGSLFIQELGGPTLPLGDGVRGRALYRLPPSMTLDLFKAYRPLLRVDGSDVTGDWLIPRVRLGAVVSKGTLRADLGIDGNAEHCYIGSGFLIAKMAVNFPAAPSSAEMVVWTQVVDRNGQVPVVRRGGITWLASANGLRVPVRIDKSGKADLAAVIGVPLDNSLVGKVLYMQGCVTDTGGAVASDICGIGIGAEARAGIQISPTGQALRDYTTRYTVDDGFVGALIDRVSHMR